MFSSALPKVPETVGGKITQDALGEFCDVMFGAWGVIGRSSSRLPVWKRRLLGAVAFGALPLLTSPGFYANYAFIDATYQFSGELSSPNNPFADANGNIFVTPGKQIPGIPRHTIKGGVDYWFTPELKLGTDVIWVSSQWFIGDDANQNPKLADYWVANLHGSYQLTKEWQIYGS